MTKTLSDNPTISDSIQIDIQTTDAYGDPINPYRVDQVVIYFIERSFTSGTYKSYVEKVSDTQELKVYYTDAIPVKTYGDGVDNPAWISTDPDSYITQELFDDDGVAQIGVFRVIWNPPQEKRVNQEGDYMICWKWTPLLSSPKQSAHITFHVKGDQSATTAIPSHVTPAGKYENLLNLYTPQMFKELIANKDVTPDVLARMNSALGKGFNDLEDLVNQTLDLVDANATHESVLPYLSNLFKHKLWSNDPTLWRRQIKRAIPLNKKKGTLSGLIEALSSAGIVLQKVTKYWQVVSQSTWTESFLVEEGQSTFVLSKKAILPIDPLNFEVSIRGVGDDEYTDLSLNYVSFSNVDNVTTMVWLGSILTSGSISLLAGDRVKVTYLVNPVTNQSVEDYIRELPLMDTRDEEGFIYPLKNWNVHLIAEDDVAFDTVISQRHPFATPVIWGKVRTEFAYSENIYNMEEYNASIRNSNIPCDIDRNFLDSCTACQSSSISLDLEIEDINNDRIKEATQIINGHIPFHAKIYSINYSSLVNEFMPPPVEDIEILIQMGLSEYVIIGQSDFNRLIPTLGTTTGQFLRNQLSTSITAASGTATGFNDEVVLYSPGIRFDKLNILDDNLLEILTGTNTGTYEVDYSDIGMGVIPINSSSPDTIAFPLNTSAFTFRLSNLLWTDAAASIVQKDLFVFSDANVNFTLTTILTENNSSTPWQIKILTGLYAGNYNINDVLPDNTLILSGWTGVVSVINLNYRLLNNSGTRILSGTTGSMNVTRRGLVTTQELASWGVIEGDWILYSGTQYQITNFTSAAKTGVYISGYTSGAASGVTIKVYRRVIEERQGYVDVRGMYIITTPNYESTLGIQDGTNPPAIPVEDSNFMGNYLVKIGSQYYSIIGWNANKITLSGPKTNWSLVGTSLSFSLINYLLTSPVVTEDGVEFSNGIDRRGETPINSDTSVAGMSLDMCTSAINNPDGIVESISATESISFTIQNRQGSQIEGVL